LTLTVAKPVMPLAGRPFLSYMLDWLEHHGVDEVILSCGFLSDGVRGVLGSRHGGIDLHYVEEPEPLGTAGPIALARSQGLLRDRLLVLNGDVLCDLDLTAQIALHQQKDAAATLALVAVEDTSSYGVVPTAPDGLVEAFLEKSPGPAPTNRINAGAYVLEAEVADSIPLGRAVSIEREIFPALVGSGLFGYEASGYWMDIGTPERYLEATRDLLAGTIKSRLPARDGSRSLVGESCATDGARIGPLAVLGSDCSVSEGALIDRAVLHDGVQIGARSVIRESIVGAGVTIGAGATVEPGAVIGSGARVRTGALVPAGARVAPRALV